MTTGNNQQTGADNTNAAGDQQQANPTKTQAKASEYTHDELVELVLKQGKELVILRGIIGNGTAISVGEKAKPGIPKELVTFENTTYRWKVAAFKLKSVNNGKMITAQEAATDKDIIATILDIEGQGLLQEVF